MLKRITLIVLATLCVALLAACSASVGFTEHVYDYGDTAFKNESVLIKTYSELENYRIAAADAVEEWNEDRYHPQDGGISTPFDEYLSQLDKYNEHFFDNFMLVVLHFSQSSGSFNVSLKNLRYDAENVEITFKREVPEIGTCDMRYWSFIIECPQDSDVKTVNYNFKDVKA